MRVNARFDQAAAQQLTFLATRTGLKVSDVLRESVAFYYRHVRAGHGQLKHLSALIGKGDSGHNDIAANVKQFVGHQVDNRYPGTRNRPRPK